MSVELELATFAQIANEIERRAGGQYVITYFDANTNYLEILRGMNRRKSAGLLAEAIHCLANPTSKATDISEDLP